MLRLHRHIATNTANYSCSRVLVRRVAGVAAPKWFDKSSTPLSFECVACGKCCRGPTNVFINQEEAAAIADHLKMSKLKFMNKYTEDRLLKTNQPIDDDNVTDASGDVVISLKSKPSSTQQAGSYDKEECVFLDANNKCSIYPVRPTGCRTYPYWPNIVMGEAEWTAEASRCDGINIASRINSKLTNMITSDATAATATAAAVSSTAVSRNTLLNNLVVHSVHGRGLGPDWVFQDSMGFLQGATELEVDKDADKDLGEGNTDSVMADFEEEFFGTHYSDIIYSDEDIRVVDATTPADDGNTVDNDDESSEASSTELITHRKLEFMNSLHLTQSEAAFDPQSKQSIDYSVLSLPVHKVMGSMIKRQMLDHKLSSAKGKQSMLGAVIGGGGCLLPMNELHCWTHINNNADTITQTPVIDVVDTSATVLAAANHYFGAKFGSDVPGAVTDCIRRFQKSDANRGIVVRNNISGILRPLHKDGSEYFKESGDVKSSFVVIDTMETIQGQ
jgi:Fe-S-cluster containining protein